MVSTAVGTEGMVQKIRAQNRDSSAASEATRVHKLGRRFYLQLSLGRVRQSRSVAAICERVVLSEAAALMSVSRPLLSASLEATSLCSVVSLLAIVCVCDHAITIEFTGLLVRRNQLCKAATVRPDAQFQLIF